MGDAVHVVVHWLLPLNMQICVSSLSHFAQTYAHLFKLFGLQLVFLHFLSFVEKIFRNHLAQKKCCLFDHH